MRHFINCQKERSAQGKFDLTIIRSLIQLPNGTERSNQTEIVRSNEFHSVAKHVRRKHALQVSAHFFKPVSEVRESNGTLRPKNNPAGGQV